MNIFDQGYDRTAVKDLKQNPVFAPCMLVIDMWDDCCYCLQINRVDMFHGRSLDYDKINNNCILSSYQPGKNEPYLVIDSSDSKVIFSLGVEGLCGIDFEVPKADGLELVRKMRQYLQKKCVLLPKSFNV